MSFAGGVCCPAVRERIMTGVSMAVKRKVTIAQVAEAAGVSQATVSRVINHPDLVSAATIDHVNSVIHDLGYASLVDQYRDTNGPRGLIIFCLPWLDNPFYSEIVRGVRVAAKNAGYDVLVSWEKPSRIGSDAFLSMLKRCAASGVITACPLPAGAIRAIETLMPVVQCCEWNPDADAPYVTIDDEASARMATDHLVSCGCKRLAIVCGPQEYKYARGRLEGFLSVAREKRALVRPSWILQVPDNSYGLAYTAVHHTLAGDETPDGVFACSDIYAAAAVRAARKVGLNIPQDLMVVGFDNVDIATMISPSLTTVNQPRYRMGYSACKILLDILSGHEDEARSALLETELIVRESTAGPTTSHI